MSRSPDLPISRALRAPHPPSTPFHPTCTPCHPTITPAWTASHPTSPHSFSGLESFFRRSPSVVLRVVWGSGFLFSDDGAMSAIRHPSPPPSIPDWRRFSQRHSSPSQIGVHFSDWPPFGVGLARISISCAGLTKIVEHSRPRLWLWIPSAVLCALRG
jgi:hypothetical protein